VGVGEGVGVGLGEGEGCGLVVGPGVEAGGAPPPIEALTSASPPQLASKGPIAAEKSSLRRFRSTAPRGSACPSSGSATATGR
jgi:hypothetical protein